MQLFCLQYLAVISGCHNLVAIICLLLSSLNWTEEAIDFTLLSLKNQPNLILVFPLLIPLTTAFPSHSRCSILSAYSNFCKCSLLNDSGGVPLFSFPFAFLVIGSWEYKLKRRRYPPCYSIQLGHKIVSWVWAWEQSDIPFSCCESKQGTLL